ncbi:MAG: LptF/LptG family permease [Bacteroidota bacterium]
MGKLDRYFIGNFVQIFAKTLALSVFILLMQMVWKYMDDLAGRGISMLRILELMGYWSVSILPMAAPIAVLFAGIMIYGQWAESKEYAAAKAAGFSFLRMLQPVTLVLAVIAVLMFFVSNNFIPVANFKGENLLLNIARQKPTFKLKPGVFVAGLDGFSVKVGRKEDNRIYDVILYDHRERGRGNTGVLTAPEGEIRYPEGSPTMTLVLRNGRSYLDVNESVREERLRQGMLAATFDSMVVRMDMSSFLLGDLGGIQRSNEFNMLTLSQLDTSIDVLEVQIADRMAEVSQGMRRKLGGWSEDSMLQARAVDTSLRVATRLQPIHRYRAVQNAAYLAKSNRDYMNQIASELDWRNQHLARHYLEWHKKFSVAVACVLLFFIGAPLGSVIQRGGFGWAFVASVLLFLLHYVLTMVSEKLGRTWVLSPFWAMWGPNLVLAPVAMAMTWWASRDGRLTLSLPRKLRATTPAA